MSVAVTPIAIGPKDVGRKMSLEDFAHAQAEDGRLYELDRGEVLMIDVPKGPHALVAEHLRDMLTLHKYRHEESIRHIYTGGETVLRAPTLQSERHPDLSIYLTTRPGEDDADFWLPEIVVEVVSPSSRTRDYQTKREDYLRMGLRAYWIVDPKDRVVVALVRHGDTWKETRFKPGDALTSYLLPGFTLPVKELFAVLDAAQPEEPS